MTSKSRFTQDKKVLICLEHLFMGGTLTIDGSEYILGDDNNLSVKGSSTNSETNKTSIVYLPFDISLSNLISMFGNIPDEEYISIAASVTLTKLRREKYNRLF
jgi:hypothetical protein